MRPGTKAISMSCPRSAAALSIAAAPPRTIMSAMLIALLPRALSLNSPRTFSSAASVEASSSVSFTSHEFMGASRTRAPLAPPRISLSRYEDAEAQAALTSDDVLAPDFKIAFLSFLISRLLTRSWSTAGIGSCHINTSSGTSEPT